MSPPLGPLFHPLGRGPSNGGASGGMRAASRQSRGLAPRSGSGQRRGRHRRGLEGPFRDPGDDAGRDHASSFSARPLHYCVLGAGHTVRGSLATIDVGDMGARSGYGISYCSDPRPSTSCGTRNARCSRFRKGAEAPCSKRSFVPSTSPRARIGRSTMLSRWQNAMEAASR